MEADQVGLRLARGLGENAVDLLEVGGGDLGGVLADLDFGDDVPLVVLDGHQLVHPAEHRLAAGGNQPLAHAEGVNAGPLAHQVPDDILVQGVGGDDLTAGQPRLVQHLPGLPGQVGQVAGVQADAALGNALGLQHLLEHPDGVGDAGF